MSQKNPFRGRAAADGKGQAARSGRTTATALAYLRAGLSLIPISQGGSKRPEGRLLPVIWDDEQGRSVSTWAPFQSALPTEDQVREWFDRSPTPGIGIIGGNVSGGLETIDFDAGLTDPYPEWCALVEAVKPGLVERLNVCRTPRKPINGHHVRYRVRGFEVPGNQPLAREPDPEKPGKLRTLIETRGTGGYALAPGSPPECHETGGQYEHIAGPPLTVLPVISITERNVLIDCARALTVSINESDLGVNDLRHASGNKPGADFNRRVSWSDVLDRHGWRLVRQSGTVCYWRRPGKDDGWSATTGRCSTEQQGDLLYVFSSNADPFEQSHAYSKFAAYALLEHGGDFGRAAAELGRNGYGDPPARQSYDHPFRGRAEGVNGHISTDPAIVPVVTGNRIETVLPVREWDDIVELWDLPEAEPFPLGVLPEPLQRYIGEGAWALNCPIDFFAVPMLGVASGAIGNSRRLQITRTHGQPALLFTCVIGFPGTSKSPALEVVVRPLEEAEARYRREYDAQAAAHEHDETLPEPDTLRRALVSDTTREALTQLLADNPRGLLMSLDEMSALIKGMDQYKAGGKGNDRQFYLGLWNQSTIRNDRKSNPEGAPVTVVRPYMAIAGGIQPEVVQEVRGRRKGTSASDDGLMDRFLFSYPNDIPAVGETWREISEDAEQTWQAVVDYLLDLPQTCNHLGLSCPVQLYLTDDGREAWSDFTQDHANEVNDDDFPSYLRGPWAKLRGYGGRLALVVHCLREACGEYLAAGVDGQSMRAATALVNYFKAHARRVLLAMDADVTVAKARRILRWIARERRDHFKRREVIVDVKNQLMFPNIDALNEPLDQLVKHNYLRVRPVVPKATTAGRTEADTYEVHPKLLESLAKGDAAETSI